MKMRETLGKPIAAAPPPLMPADFGGRCAVTNLFRTLAVHPLRVKDALRQRMRSGRGNFDESRPEAHPFLLATAMFLTQGHHTTPVETLRTQAAEVLARLMSKERSAPSMEMITAFSRCMNADQVIARLKVMIGDCAELNLQTSSQRSDRKGEPRTISTFPPVSDDDFHAAHDAAHAVLGERPRDKTRYRRPDASGNYVDASGDLRDADGNFQWSHDGQTLPAGEMDAQLARNPNTSRETSTRNKSTPDWRA